METRSRAAKKMKTETRKSAHLKIGDRSRLTDDASIAGIFEAIDLTKDDDPAKEESVPNSNSEDVRIVAPPSTSTQSRSFMSSFAESTMSRSSKSTFTQSTLTKHCKAVPSGASTPHNAAKKDPTPQIQDASTLQASKTSTIKKTPTRKAKKTSTGKGKKTSTTSAELPQLTFTKKTSTISAKLPQLAEAPDTWHSLPLSDQPGAGSYRSSVVPCTYIC